MKNPRESVHISDEPRVSAQDGFESMPEGYTLFFPKDASFFAYSDFLAPILNSFSLKANDARINKLKNETLLDFGSTRIFQVIFFFFFLLSVYGLLLFSNLFSL